jgi:hypothetical protein
MEIIGEGSIGDKAKQLEIKTRIIDKLGFNQSKRVVLAQGFLDSILKNNDLANHLSAFESHPNFNDWTEFGEIKKRLYECKFSDSQSRTLNQIVKKFSGKPLAVRSSASGDSRGTGVYDSKFTDCDTSYLKRAILEVMASYFTRNALDFRRDANCEEGLAVIVEPIIGQWHQTSDFWIKKLFGPVISGFGYTSTPRDANGFISMIQGLGGGVDYPYRKKITPIVLEEHRGKLNELVKNQSPWHYGFNSKLEEGSRKHVSSGLLLSDNIKRLVDTLDLNEMFKKMGLLEEACGKPQYFEWALTSGECKPEYWITQISDVEVVRDMYNFSGIGNVLIEGNEAVGTGKLGSTRIAYCRSMDSLPALRKFNRANENYILVFSGFLTSDWRSMSYGHYGNANVLLEAHSSIHNHGDSLAHFGGRTQLTGKLFGCVDHKATNMARIFSNSAKDNISIVEGTYTTIGSEYQNRVVVLDNRMRN